MSTPDDELAVPAPHSPRGLRLMAWVRWVLLALVTALAGYTVWTFWGPAAVSPSSQHEAHFYCPMHPQIRSPDPGECPICHMDLEPIPAERQSEAEAEPASSAVRPNDVVPISLSEEKQQLIGLTTSLVTKDSLGDRLRVPGVVTAPETGLSQVRVRAPGFVEQVAVRQTGTRVARGQTLAWVYSPEIYRAQEEFIAATRWTEIPGSEAPFAGSTEMAAAARRGLELLGLSKGDIDQVAQTGKAIRAIPLRSPSTGYITRFNAVLGSRADPETVLYEIADLSTVWVVASVHERDLSHLRVGMPASVSVSGLDEPAAARVELIEPALDERTRTARVRLALPNRDFTFRPGQFGEVSLELPAAEGLFAPRDALIRTGEHEYVYVAVALDRFEPRVVRSGAVVNDRVQIFEGLVAGDRIVTRGSFMLDSESRFKASLAAAPSSASSTSPPVPSR